MKIEKFEFQNGIIICPHPDGDHVLSDQETRADEVCQILWSTKQETYTKLLVVAPRLYDVLVVLLEHVRGGADLRKEPELLNKIEELLSIINEK